MLVNVVVKVNKKNKEVAVIAMYRDIEKAIAFVKHYEQFGYYGYKVAKKEVRDNVVFPVYA